MLFLNSGLVCLSEVAIVVWENTSSVLSYFGNWKPWVKNISTENQEFLFGKAAKLPVTQVLCLSHATVLLYLLERDEVYKFAEEGNKTATNSLSCIFLYFLAEVPRELEWFTMKLWKQTASVSTFPIPAAAAQCLLHSPPKLTTGLIECMQFVPILHSGQSCFSPFEHGPEKEMKPWELALVYCQHITEVRGKELFVLGRKTF